MKSVKIIQDELDHLLSLPTEKEAKRILNQRRKRVKFLTICKYWLETNPQENHIKQAINEQKILLTRLTNKEFYSDLRGEQKRKYDKLHEIPKIKDQIKTLNFILK